MVASAPIPANEQARLAALHSHHILDTPPDERFDLFTRLTTWAYGVPVSAINLVDADTTFFKSCIGFPAFVASRSTSMCAHAVAGDEDVMMVEDLSRDERFHDHPFVHAKTARFYAGAVVRSASNHNLGTLCVMDANPRSFSAGEREKLAEMAKGVGAVLELHRTSLLLRDSSNRDSLTGLPSRRLLAERLQAAVARSRLGEACALMFLDLDRFKHVNDRFGHAGGDALLCEVARRLNNTVRDGDIVARFAGDEFAILMNGFPTVASSERLARRVLAAFAIPFVYKDETIPISCSIGIALCPDHALNVEALLQCADTSLYSAKRSGRNQIQMYRNAHKAMVN